MKAISCTLLLLLALAVLVEPFTSPPTENVKSLRPAGIGTFSATLDRSDTQLKSSLSDTSTSTENQLKRSDDIKTFEDWLKNQLPSMCSNAYYHPSVQHAWFGTNIDAIDPNSGSSSNTDGLIRGLQWTASVQELKKSTLIARIPASHVISTTSRNKEEAKDIPWDADLALQLCRTLQQQNTTPSSDIANTASISTDKKSLGLKDLSGYLTFLTQGDTTMDYSIMASPASAPPSTAPDALRHWSEPEIQMLLSLAKECSVSSLENAQKLIDVELVQSKRWQDYYQRVAALPDDGVPVPRGLFFWALEAVHSRAFYGIEGGTSRSSSSSIVGDGSKTFTIGQGAVGAIITRISSLSVAAPILAGAIGYYYYLQYPWNASPEVLAGIGLVGALPTLLQLASSFTSLTTQNINDDAVILPLIDSCNHREQATDSKIQYNPLSDSFELTCGPNSLVRDPVTGKYQIFISYGKKSPAELLLNYGFQTSSPSIVSEQAKQDNQDDGIDDSTWPKVNQGRIRLAQAFVESYKS